MTDPGNEKMDRLRGIADLVRRRNAIHREMAALVGRPASSGHVGEWIASQVFGIALHASATQAGSDGHFAEGPLARRSVNVKWYPAFCGLLDVNPAAVPDYYLVLTGRRLAPASSRGTDQPWEICSIFLFAAQPLLETLRARGVKIGVATSLRQEDWKSAEVYPGMRNPALVLTAQQRAWLALFAGDTP